MESNCPRCGLDFPPGSYNFCPGCGYKFEHPIEIQSPMSQPLPVSIAPVSIASSPVQPVLGAPGIPPRSWAKSEGAFQYLVFFLAGLWMPLFGLTIPVLGLPFAIGYFVLAGMLISGHNKVQGLTLARLTAAGYPVFILSSMIFGSRLAETQSRTNPAPGVEALGKEEETKKKEETKSIRWVTVAQWQGVGIKTTEIFTIDSDEWAVAWQCGESQHGFDIFQGFIYNADKRFDIGVIGNVAQPAKDISYFHKGGRYYIEVNSTCPWSILVSKAMK